MPITNERDQVLRYPTPVFRDMMFHEKVDSTLPKNRNPKIGQAHRDPVKYPHHKLCHVEPVSADNANDQIWHYIVDREQQDEFNWEHSTCNIGGRKFAAVERTYVTLRTAYNPATPALGSTMPLLGKNVLSDNAVTGDNSLGVEIALFGSGYVLVDRTEVRTEQQEIDNLYVVEKRIYAKKVSIASLEYDQQFGGVLPSSDTIYHRDEVVTGGSTMLTLAGAPTNAYWGLQSNGVVRTWEQLSDEWYVVNTRTIVPGTFSNGVVTVADFTTNDNYSWPAVLNTIEFMDWVKREGGEDIFPRVEMLRERYDGPCLTTVAMTWKSTPHTIAKVPQMLPTSIHYASPFFTINIPACLHPAIDLVCDIGSNDPDYTANTGSTRTTDATNYTDWPGTIVAYDEQTLFRGGYLRTTKTVTKPS